MENKKNYQLVLDKTIENIKKEGKKPSLLLHACCAPCSSYCLEYLNEFFDITVLFFNPNISPKEEYDFRAKEIERFIAEYPFSSQIKCIVEEYDDSDFKALSEGLEDAREGGSRCFKCYELRLRKTAETAKKNGFDYFTTTLTISPHKNAKVLNEIGEKLQNEYEIPYLFSDFKKKNGYKKSCQLSEEYNLYRQNYCGCIYSKIEAENRTK